MSTEEICAVFAHGPGHRLHKDVLKSQILKIIRLLIMAMVALGCISQPMFHTDFGFAEVNYGFAYTLIGIFLGTVQPVLSLIMNAISRWAEYRAGRQAVKEG